MIRRQQAKAVLLATALLLVLILLPAATAFLLPSATKAPQRQPLHAASGSREKRPLSWQESLELLLSPTTPMAQRQVLLQVGG